MSCRKNGAHPVVLGYDTERNYEKIKTAALLLQKPGVAYLASHCDRVCPTEDGPIPDIGNMISLFETATGRAPDMVFGKPNACMVTDIKARDGLTAAEVFLVEDRIYTDGESAHRVGCDFICVLSGETDRAMLEELDPAPRAIVRNVGDLVTGADDSKNQLECEGV